MRSQANLSSASGDNTFLFCRESTFDAQIAVIPPDISPDVHVLRQSRRIVRLIPEIRGFPRETLSSVAYETDIFIQHVKCRRENSRADGGFSIFCPASSLHSGSTTGRYFLGKPRRQTTARKGHQRVHSCGVNGDDIQPDLPLMAARQTSALIANSTSQSGWPKTLSWCWSGPPPSTGAVHSR